MPAEDAEIIAQFMAQMIMNGVVPDGSAWGAERKEGREPGLVNAKGDENSIATTPVPPTPEFGLTPVPTPSSDREEILPVNGDYVLEQIELGNGEEALQNYIEQQGIEAYKVEDLPFHLMEDNQFQLVAEYLGLDGEPAGISIDEITTQIDVLQAYWGLENSVEGKAELASRLREIYYEQALDSFIAGASLMDREALLATISEGGGGSSEAALAYTLLYLSGTAGGVDETGLQKNPALVPVNVNGSEVALDHVVAAIDAYYHPIEEANGLEGDDIRKAAWLLFYNPGPEGPVRSIPAVTFAGDLGVSVWRELQGNTFEEATGLEMTDTDIEGDVLGAALVYSGLLETDASLAHLIRQAYTPGSVVYENRYALFADAFSLEIVDGGFTTESREQFVETELDAVVLYGAGLMGKQVWDTLLMEPDLSIVSGINNIVFERGLKLVSNQRINWFFDKIEQLIAESG